MIDAEAVQRWEEALGLRRTAVLAVTVWMSWRAFAWATQYAVQISLSDGVSGLAAAAVIGAVTAPITYLQTAVFRAYLDSKGSA